MQLPPGVILAGGRYRTYSEDPVSVRQPCKYSEGIGHGFLFGTHGQCAGKATIGRYWAIGTGIGNDAGFRLTRGAGSCRTRHWREKRRVASRQPVVCGFRM